MCITLQVLSFLLCKATTANLFLLRANPPSFPLTRKQQHQQHLISAPPAQQVEEQHRSGAAAAAETFF